MTGYGPKPTCRVLSVTDGPWKDAKTRSVLGRRLTSQKLIPASTAAPILPRILPVTRDAAAERLRRGKVGARLRRCCSVRSIVARLALLRCRGPEARLCMGGNTMHGRPSRSGTAHIRAGQPPPVPDDGSPPSVCAGGTDRLVDVVLSTLDAAKITDAGAERLPD